MYNKGEIFSALSDRYQPLLSEEIAGMLGTDRTGFRKTQVSRIRAAAAEFLKSPIPSLSYHAFSLYDTTGNRVVFENLYFERRRRLVVFSITSLLEPENQEFCDALNETVWAICSEPFWSLPAHFLSENDEPIQFRWYATNLDLFSCETGFALAEVLEVNQEVLAPLVTEQIRAQVRRRIFEPFLDSGRFHRFEAMRNNWSAVCGGAIGGAAIHLIQDRAVLASILHRCLSCLDVYIHSFGEDGVCTEGVDYWTYGFGFFTCFADLLQKRTNGKLNLFSIPQVRAIAKSQQWFYFSGGSTISFSDGSINSHFRMGLSCWLQNHLDSIAIPPQAFAAPVLEDPCARYGLVLRDLLWYDETAKFSLQEETACWLPQAEWFLSRKGDLAVAAKGGHNGESHNHNDCGSFIIFKNGEQILCDLGAGLYDAFYFGKDRYRFFVNRSYSHNLPLIGGQEQQPGAEFRAENARASFSGGKNCFSADLTGCYGHRALDSFVRMLEHDTIRQMVILEDTFCFREPDSVTEVFISLGSIQLADGVAVITGEHASANLRFDASAFTAQVVTATYQNHEDQETTAHLLLLKAKEPAAHLRYQITIE